MGQGASAETTDSGLACLVLLLRVHGLAADPERIRHQLGGAAVGEAEILRIAKAFGLKVRAVDSDWSRLQKTPLPAIAARQDGGCGATLKMASCATIRIPHHFGDLKL
ncbi:cysteine peptidase family C39 domain-containing protein [Blastochloris sulfoviridis]|uniref:Peptidase C39 domain-containing protein n=1 Tax=Blastochloris sulfoviridis TaxID=50712 RepID=A0A5M6HMR6_9HYPH|nr:cysteine peptidase family C39 domain-containing protein [Blastochloris sulfoviridis]KAA5597136.1 hypothetical protein F1193_15140 [Blastochloris sulfoviridis]